jgi:hypothetical protein
MKRPGGQRRQPRRPGGRHRAPVVALTVLAALLGGCSSAPAQTGTSTSPSASAAQQAPTPSATSPAPTPAPDMRELAQRMNAAAKAKRTAQVLFTTGSATTMKGAIRYHGNGADVAVTVTDTSGKHVKIVVIGSVGYLATGEKFLGKTWVKISSTSKDAVSKANAQALTTLSTSLDLSGQLAKARDAKIESSSPAELDGVPMTRYVVTISERDYLDQLPSTTLTPAQRRQIAARLKGAHGRTVLYVDDADLLRRAESTLVGGKAPVPASVVTYSHWGEPVEISAPPTSDTVDASALG